jgi:Glu-tRNA(Gln) amidotransferase subunit E-like FAD-binding protein
MDYEKLGFKCGLEIHQQLDSKKLFCECPSILRSEEPDFVVTRKLHAVAGESGKIDVAAAYQAGLGKEFVYQGYDENVCLVDLDEEPPHEIDKEALKIAVHISLLLNCKIVPMTQIMRKTVVDGSNTGGFQRTVLIGQDGWIETETGKVGIDYVYLEEDSARIVDKAEDQTIYRLDRLGIPLVEIVTAPDVKNAEQCKEVAFHIGDILRSCKVRRGIGTIRQDINVSIKGHSRAEIKGFQDPKIFVDVVNKEIERQKSDLTPQGCTPKIKDFTRGKKNLRQEVRGALEDGSTKFLRPLPGQARMYPETDLGLLKISREFINDAKKTLPKLRTEIASELKESGLNQEMIKLILKKNMISEFKDLVSVLNRPDLIAKMLLVFPREISRHEAIEFVRVERFLNRDALIFVLEQLKAKKISENQIKQILIRIAKGTRPQDAVLFKKQDVGAVEERIIKLIKEKPGLSDKAYMGLIMKEFSGRVTGKEAMDLIQKYL